jgi:hypothetical protein
VEGFDLEKEDGRNSEDVIRTNNYSSVEFEFLTTVIERNYRSGKRVQFMHY